MKFNVFLFNVYKRFLFLSRFLRFLTFVILISTFFHLCSETCREIKQAEQRQRQRAPKADLSSNSSGLQIEVAYWPALAVGKAAQLAAVHSIARTNGLIWIGSLQLDVHPPMSSILLCLLFRFRCSTFFDKKTFVRINSWPLYYNFRLGCAIIAAATDSIRTIVLIVTLESPISLQAAVFSHPCLSTGSASLLRRNNLYVKSFSQYSRRQFCRHYRSL